ncbi:hypothetical protein KUCAC02_027498, partial [Chaenocephalus aceratus]
TTEAAALVVAQADMEKVGLSGNCLGEEGRDALREAMEKGDMLGSLSDDEGEPEDEDDDQDDHLSRIMSFLSFPSAEKLLQLGETRTNVQQQEPETKTTGLQTIDAVLKKLLSGSDLSSYCFLSTLLVMMGLLKGEGKVKKVPLVPGQLLCWSTLCSRSISRSTWPRCSTPSPPETVKLWSPAAAPAAEEMLVQGEELVLASCDRRIPEERSAVEE